MPPANWNGNQPDAGNGNGNPPATEEPTGEKMPGLTNSSSATGTGEVKLAIHKQPERRWLFAGARG